MDRIGPSGFIEFDRLGVVFGRTLALLHALTETGDLPAGASEVLATETLPHIEDVEAGFRVRLRATETNLAELRALVLVGGLGLPEPRDAAEARAALIEAMRARAGAGGERTLATSSGRGFAALEHARLVFALMPATPAPSVRYPAGRRTYADIAAPRSPGELAGRIEELERRLWHLATGRLPRPSDAGYRRVYGFFDIGERLVNGDLRLS
ncbi:MAG: hypothetical protein H0T04_01625 [Chloroflexi bacterium]|nr:hypothetical protein [Chloroflexota bacterium]MBA3851379.1 hypothetical protein [Chloroflexota bacterium]